MNDKLLYIKLFDISNSNLQKEIILLVNMKNLLLYKQDFVISEFIMAGFHCTILNS